MFMINSANEIQVEILTMSKCSGPLITGIDEAGRGPVIGPMVIACVSIPKDKFDEMNKLLLSIGVKDSKLLSKRKREELFSELMHHLPSVIVAYISPKIIDEYTIRNEYNWLEAKVISKLLSLVSNTETAYIDAPSSSEDFERKIRRCLMGEFPRELVVEKQADKKYSIVSAASIVAKVLRDRAIKKIKEELKIDFGSGYPSDPKTREALPIILKIKPEIVRKSWKTIRRLQQVRLDDLTEYKDKITRKDTSTIY